MFKTYYTLTIALTDLSIQSVPYRQEFINSATEVMFPPVSLNCLSVCNIIEKHLMDLNEIIG